MLPRIVDVLDEPIGDPAAINTLLMCEAARERGVKVILSGMGADELFGGYRKHLACVMASRYGRLPRLRRGLACGPPSTACRSARPAGGCATPRWAKRFLTFAELPEEPRFRRSYTLYDPPRARRADQPGPGRLRGPGRRGARRDLQRQLAARRDQPDVPGRHAHVPARPQPGLHRPGQHGRLGRGPGAVRRSGGSPGGVLDRRARQDPRARQGKVALKQAAESWLPHEIVHRPKASFSAPLRAWVRNDLHEVIQDVLVGGELAGSGMIRREALLQPDRRRAGRP